MNEPVFETQRASDGYDIHTTVWPARGELRGRLVVLHGIQSHGGWYHGLGRFMTDSGYETHFPDRRGSGANEADRGHAASYRRLIGDVAERLLALRKADANSPVVLAGISWGAKVALVTAAEHPDLVDALALICPGLCPRVGVSLRERVPIAFAFLTDRHRRFPLPLGDPRLFTDNPTAQEFIRSDPLGLREGTAGLLAASNFLDRRLRRVPSGVRQPVVLMLAGQDRIIDNARTVAYFQKISSDDKTIIHYPDAHHTLEFETDRDRYARDLANWLNRVTEAGPVTDSGVPRPGP